MKKVYLIAQWHPGRGQNGPEDGCLFCSGYIVKYPLHDVNRAMCYQTEKRAVRVMEKNKAVVEVPEEALKENV